MWEHRCGSPFFCPLLLPKVGGSFFLLVGWWMEDRLYVLNFLGKWWYMVYQNYPFGPRLTFSLRPPAGRGPPHFDWLLSPPFHPLQSQWVCVKIYRLPPNSTILSGWWFGTFFTFPYIGNNHPNWLSYFSEGFKPPTILLSFAILFANPHFQRQPKMTKNWLAISRQLYITIIIIGDIIPWNATYSNPYPLKTQNDLIPNGNWIIPWQCPMVFFPWTSRSVWTIISH